MMKEKDPQNVNGLLQDFGDSGLRKIVRQAQRLAAMDRIMAACLPPNLAPHCHTAQVTATELILMIDSAAWMTHLRYIKPQLLQQLKKHPQCAYLQEIQLRIQPGQTLPDKTDPTPIPKKISADTCELLRTTAESVENPLLKKALIKLASGNIS